MHDKNGNLVSSGDFVKLKTFIQGESTTVVGQVMACKPGSET